MSQLTSSPPPIITQVAAQVVARTFDAAVAASEALIDASSRYVGDMKTMFKWGDSNAINTEWVPPNSIIGTPNTPRGVMQLINVTIFFTMMWFAVTIMLRRYYSTRTDAYVSRVVSLIHASLSFLFSGYCCYLRYKQSKSGGDYISTFTCLAEPPLADEQLNGVLSSSYFIMDTIGIVFGSYYDPMFVLHHIGALIAINAGIFAGTIGPEMAVGLFLLEGSNPFLHMRWLLQAEKYDIHYPDSPLWQFINKGFYVSFILARQVLGSLSAYNFMLCMWVPWYIRVIGVAYWVFSLKFLIDVLKKDREGERWMQ